MVVGKVGVGEVDVDAIGGDGMVVDEEDIENLDE